MTRVIEDQPGDPSYKTRDNSIFTAHTSHPENTILSKNRARYASRLRAGALQRAGTRYEILGGGSGLARPLATENKHRDDQNQNDRHVQRHIPDIPVK